MLILKKIIIGFSVLFIILSLLSGGPQMALGIFAISIICTLGGGLAIWLPLSYGIGALVVNLMKRSPVELAEASASNEEMALKNYIKQARHFRLSDKEITLRLKEKGWSEDLIRRFL